MSEEAIIDYTKAIEINPQFDDAYLNRGRYQFLCFLGYALSNLERYEDAIIDYTKALEFDPHHAKAFYKRGINFFQFF